MEVLNVKEYIILFAVKSKCPVVGGLQIQFV